MVEKSIEVMNKEQFRSQMGLLGQQQHPFLADRMFEVFEASQFTGAATVASSIWTRALWTQEQ